MSRKRRSAKDVVETYASDLLSRKTDPDIKGKLMAVEHIAFKMGWNELYNKLRYGRRHVPENHIENEPTEPWWQK